MQKETTTPQSSKRREWIAMLFVVFVFFPILSVMVVGGYGFAVWIFQMFFGPPGHNF
ncbi:periplasmic nitrate reductase, NapE protein [Halomonas sp. M20]|uniref:periplasmic nitrate reductase, NapE protein n=1 Tax=Halomonas sp. M20 TaxID=2763264 RepID=UPI001D0BAD0F|nr:periplasmic nitrate reductase, NapE protein [Halomonas sp. M20]